LKGGGAWDILPAMENSSKQGGGPSQDAGAGPEKQAADGAATPIRGRFFVSPLFWILLVTFVCGGTIVRSVRNRLPAAPPVLAQVGDFELIGQHGKPFGSEQLRGKVWVADFIFTRCPTICPTLTERMFQVQHRSRNLSEAFHIVSFTVDPEHDTPEVLAEYAFKNRHTPRVWTYVTGERAEIHRIVVDDMKMAMGVEGDTSEPDNIYHGPHFVLIDQAMRVRGYYDTDHEGELNRLLQDAGLLANIGAHWGAPLRTDVPGARPPASADGGDA
jgi:protein SCO1/2